MAIISKENILKVFTAFNHWNNESKDVQDI